MAVDVVVCNFKTPDLLKNFIDSYEKSAWEGCTLTIVDVGFSGMVARTSNWDMYYMFNDNIGYGKACNVGAAFGKNDVILLANADTLLTNPGLRECHDALLTNRDWGVLGPRQVDANNRFTAGGIFGHDKCPNQRGWQELDYGQYSDIRTDALTVSGALYFIKRRLWKELTNDPRFQKMHPGSVGAFLETKVYFEETNASYRARAHGYKCVYFGPVKMTHLWHRSFGLGGWGEDQFIVSQQMHRNVCEAYGIQSE